MQTHPSSTTRRGMAGRLLLDLLLITLLAVPALPAVASEAPPASGAPAAEPPAAATGEGAAEEDPFPEAPPAPALPASPELQVPIEAEATSWDGSTIPLSPDGETAPIPAQANFRLFSERALVDLRIKLVDEAGRLVPTRDRATVGSGTNYEVRPVEPLITGTRYRLLIDGQLEPHARDVEGISYGARSFGFLTEGEKPPPPPKVRARRRR